MKYYIWTIGCQMNVADSQRVASALEKLGYHHTPRAEDADVIVLNTCVVRQSAEDKVNGRLNSLRPLKQRRPDMVINLMGCLVGVKGNHNLESSFPHVDVFSPPSDPGPLIEHLARVQGKDLENTETEIRHAIMDGNLILPHNERDLVSAYVPVVEGCSHACSFCVIPLRRGAERSRQPDEIVAEIRCLAQQGVAEITLLGQIVDRYGTDLDEGITLSTILRRIHEIEDIKRIRFLTSHPNWMTDDLLYSIAELPKVCEHIEVPMQAGDNDILRLMKRGYTIEEYRRLIDRIRERLPGVSLATDVIVGFPGESDEQFQRTYRALEELRFDVVHIARYSPRPGTVAARRMEDDVTEEEKMHRFRALEALQAKIASEINARFQGRMVEVLVEEKHRGRWKGRTMTNKLVFFEADGDLRGATAAVHIEWAGPWSMQGKYVETTPMKSKTSIAVTT